MKFAHFSHVWGKKGMTPAERYQQLWRELELCDDLGFDYGFCVEHHFRPDESWMSAPSLYTVGAGARTKRMRIGPMGYIVPLNNPIRMLEEIAIADQMLDGRMDVGLVPGINPDYFGPFNAGFDNRREVTLEFFGLLRAAYADGDSFSFSGKYHNCEELTLSVRPAQRPHPPLWLETRDEATLEFCAREGLHTGYFLLVPRDVAAPKYRRFVELWDVAGWDYRPNIAYSTVVYVDETDEKALETALADAGNAYRGFFPSGDDPEELKRVQHQRAEMFDQRGEPGSAEIMRNLLDPDYLLENELILIGSPDTVTEKLRQFASDGMFNTFFAELNFGQLSEEDLMRSIRLFGTEVMPRLRDFEPF